MPRLFGDDSGLDEELVGLVLVALACPGHVNNRIDDDIGDVHALRSELARHGLGQDPLRRLGRRKASERGFAAQGRRIPGGDDVATPGADHGGREPPRQIQQPHRVDLEIAVEHRRVDLEEGAEGTADRVVHQVCGRSELPLDVLSRSLDLCRVGDVTGIASGTGELAF